MRTQAGVAVFLLTDRQDFQRAQEAAARTVAARTGLRIEVAFADNSPVLQIKQIYSCINRPPEARPAARLDNALHSANRAVLKRSCVKSRRRQ